jgi:uncharacterized membrane protein
MLPWTHAVGTSLRAIRFPSALFGLACLPLLFCFGALAGHRMAGAVAAVFLAASGYHVFWSQVARMFALACFLGLAASVLLLLIVRGARPRALLLAAYVALILAGVATHVFFWSLFAVHLIWAFEDSRSSPAMPAVLRTQWLAFVLGSPFLAFAAYQSGNTVAELSRDALRYLAEFLPFAFALPSEQSGFFTSAAPFTGSPLAWAVRGLALLVAAFLLVRGWRALWRRSPGRQAKPETAPPAPTSLAWESGVVLAAVIATATIGGFLYLAHRLPPEFIHSTIALTRKLLILPAVLALVALALERLWPRLPEPFRWERRLHGAEVLPALLAVGPFLLLAAAAQLRPILNQRGFLLLAPYLLLLLAIGLLSLRRGWIAALSPALAALFVASLASYGRMNVDPADYAHFAASLQSAIKPADLVFIRKAWYETPILYYLNKNQYHLVGRDYAGSCTADPGADVWVVLLYDAAPTSDMQAALSGYQATQTITGSQARAILYQRPRAAAPRASGKSRIFEKRAVLWHPGFAPAGAVTESGESPDLASRVRGGRYRRGVRATRAAARRQVPA